MEAELGERDPCTITRVRLSNKSYSAEAAAVIAGAVEKMTGVTEVGGEAASAAPDECVRQKSPWYSRRYDEARRGLAMGLGSLLLGFSWRRVVSLGPVCCQSHPRVHQA